MQKTVVPIKGMHCRSCELLIEDELCTLPGVHKAVVSEKNASAEVYYKGNINVADIDAAVARAGYQVGIPDKKPFLTKDGSVYSDIIISVIALFFLYIFVDMYGLSKLFATGAGHPTSLITVVLIGITAGLSTCMALIGGLVLGASARFSAKHPEATTMQRFKPHLFFNAGRILSYIFFGGAIGMLGSFFQLSGGTLGLVTLAVALVMLTLGLQLTGLFPRITGTGFTLPKSISRFFGIENKTAKEYSHKNSMGLGGLTFFLPCGFTQAMQLYAMSTGSFAHGAAIMGAFAIGTAPGLLGIGGLTAAIRGGFAKSFFRFAGVVVIALSLFNAQNGFNLLGTNPLDLVKPSNAYDAANAATERVGEFQVVRMTQHSSGYEPNSFTVQKGVPVKWIITSTDANSCASSILLSKYGIAQSLHPGENIIEFTPRDTGRLPFSCSMGMFRGSFTVVDDPKAAVGEVVNEAPIAAAPVAAGAGCGMGGGGCGCAGAAKNIQDVAAPPAEKKGNMQYIKTVYSQDTDISPNQFTVKAGIPVRMEVNADDDGAGCMAALMVPGLADTPQVLRKGKMLVYEFTPKEKGDYPITCAMGMQRGTISVI